MYHHKSLTMVLPRHQQLRINGLCPKSNTNTHTHTHANTPESLIVFYDFSLI